MSGVSIIFKNVRHLSMKTMRWLWLLGLVVVAFRYLSPSMSDQQARPITTWVESVRDVASIRRENHLTHRTVTDRSNQNPDQFRKSVNHSIASINEIHQTHFKKIGLQSAEEGNWLTICRRLSLALVGQGLSLEEIRSLQNAPETERVDIHLQNLFKDPRYHNYWAERWTRYLVGTDGGQFIVYRRRRFRIWLSEVIAENRPYDEIVRKLLTAEGLWTDRPEVNFYTATFDSNNGQADPIRLASRTARVFLGLRIDCLQCHDDFLGNVNLGDRDQIREGKQQDFHQLAAFFSAAKTNGLQGLKKGFSNYKYQYLDAKEEVTVEPKVPFAEHLMPDLKDPRERLAAWITHEENHQAAVAAVSHVWALIFGKPFGEAVDNLPLDRSSQPILDELAKDFIAHQFDLRRLITVITGLKAFRCDSRADFPITEEHEDQYAVFPLMQLRPEQVAGAIIQASRIKKTDRDSSLLLQFISFTNTNEFVERFGDRGEDELEPENVTISQRLLMMNGKMVRESIESNPILNTTAHLAMFSKDDSQLIESAYLCTLNRFPSENEHQHFLKRLQTGKNRNQAVVDLMWVLTNSSELTWNH